MRLSHTFVEGEEPEVVDLPRLEPYEFPGDVPTLCELREGPIQDLSVFLRKGTVLVTAETISIGSQDSYDWEPQGRTGFLFVTQGEVKTGGLRIKAGEALRVDLETMPLERPLVLQSSVQSGGEAAQAILLHIEHG